MHSSLALSAGHALAASPQMQQAIRLLQMSSLEFLQQLQIASQNNPFLESIDTDQHQTDETQIDEHAEEAATANDIDSLSSELLPSDEHPSIDADAIAGHLQEALSEPYDIDYTSNEQRHEGESDERFDRMVCTENLRTHLLAQVCGSHLNQRERFLADMVIETLDDDGYLRHPVEASIASIAGAEMPDDDELEAAIKLVQEFDPPGIAARDLGECLRLQLLAMPSDEPGHAMALVLVRDSLPALAQYNFYKLALQHDTTPAEIHRALNLIRRTDPHPGHRYSQTAPAYVLPDVIIVERDGTLVAAVNPAMLPKLHLNKEYVSLLRRSRDGSHPAMQQQLQEARWLLRNAAQRFSTIQRVADAILKRQRAFFTYGDVALKPLALREVADEIGLHESTVSRATGNKTMATARGLLPFKHFFSRELATDTGGICSAASVRALMRELLDEECAQHPLTDVMLAQRLSTQGICVARRTVAKYRNQMKIPSAELRRRA